MCISITCDCYVTCNIRLHVQQLTKPKETQKIELQNSNAKSPTACKQVHSNESKINHFCHFT